MSDSQKSVDALKASVSRLEATAKAVGGAIGEARMLLAKQQVFMVERRMGDDCLEIVLNPVWRVGHDKDGTPKFVRR